MQNQNEQNFFLEDDRATIGLGRRMAYLIEAPAVIFLRGQLGAGKTTLSRGFLRGRGYDGSVKSPTYTLVETYEDLTAAPVYHLDLYRLGATSELVYLGLEDYIGAKGILLIEWPERAESVLPRPDVDVTMLHMETGREARIISFDRPLPIGISS